VERLMLRRRPQSSQSLVVPPCMRCR
jgi:hypothetical protein